MLSNLEALEALAATGTMGHAGRRLRISQSAVSKRIAALEAQIGGDLVERVGRRAVLTPRAERLLEAMRPLLAELRTALQGGESSAPQATVLAVGVSESILASWGAALLKRAAQQAPAVELRLHAHRSPVVAERVASGEYALGLVAGDVLDATGLTEVELLREPMVLLPSGLGVAPDEGASVDVITIEERSGTWGALGRRAAKSGVRATVRVESFFAAARMAMAGFGHGLVPVGVCEALGLAPEQWRVLPRLARPVSVVARKTTLARPAVAALVAAISAECSRRPPCGAPSDDDVLAERVTGQQR
jgi:DNA-binding transcriptional LysR family regulator